MSKWAAGLFLRDTCNYINSEWTYMNILYCDIVSLFNLHIFFVFHYRFIDVLQVVVSDTVSNGDDVTL